MGIKVGSVIYIIDPKKKTVIPARVNEQIVTRTVQGEKVTHNVEFSSGKNLNLESLNAAFFESLDEVRIYLLERAKELIDAGIKDAESIAIEKFQTEAPIEAPSVVYESEESDDGVKITLDNGQKVNIKVPPEFLNENINH